MLSTTVIVADAALDEDDAASGTMVGGIGVGAGAHDASATIIKANSPAKIFWIFIRSSQ
jgi:hypothetical protein